MSEKKKGRFSKFFKKEDKKEKLDDGKKVTVGIDFAKGEDITRNGKDIVFHEDDSNVGNIGIFDNDYFLYHTDNGMKFYCDNNKLVGELFYCVEIGATVETIMLGTAEMIWYHVVSIYPHLKTFTGYDVIKFHRIGISVFDKMIKELDDKILKEEDEKPNKVDESMEALKEEKKGIVEKGKEEVKEADEKRSVDNFLKLNKTLEGKEQKEEQAKRVDDAMNKEFGGEEKSHHKPKPKKESKLKKKDISYTVTICDLHDESHNWEENYTYAEVCEDVIKHFKDMVKSFNDGREKSDSRKLLKIVKRYEDRNEPDELVYEVSNDNNEEKIKDA